MREEWREWHRKDQRTPARNLKIAFRQEVIDWVSSAWHFVTGDTVKHSFKSCGISLALDSTEDSLLNDRLTAALIGQNDDNPRKEELLFDSDSELIRLAFLDQNRRTVHNLYALTLENVWHRFGTHVFRYLRFNLSYKSLRQLHIRTITA